MAKLYLHTYKVRGSFPFPLDMLRYDQSFPAHEHETAIIADCVTGHGPRGIIGHTITLRAVGPKEWHPTGPRWGSFLWTVVEIVGKIEL